MISAALLFTFFIAIIAGVIRGITGFGGGLVLAPALSVILDPKLAVMTVLVLESIATAPMLRKAMNLVDYRLIGPIFAAAFLTVPLGTYVLTTADPLVLRRIIAVIVIAFSLILLKGLRYSAPPTVRTSMAVGAFSGVLLGATSLGGPPIMLYLLSGGTSAKEARANLTLFVGATSIVGLSLMWLKGAFELQGMLHTLMLVPCYYGGVTIGIRLFPHFSEQNFRQFTLALLIVIATAILVL